MNITKDKTLISVFKIVIIYLKWQGNYISARQ